MYLLDTTLFSYIFRDDPLAALYSPELEAEMPLFLSAQTVGELYFGASAKGWGEKRRERLAAMIGEYSVLPIDAETAAIYGGLRSAVNAAGRYLDSKDAWIMATAKQYRLTLLSHDRDMTVGDQIGVKVVCRLP